MRIYFEKMSQYAEDPNNQTKLKCNECGSELKRIIVPPRWDKEKFYSDILVGIWRKARIMLYQADIVYVVGYSLPESDIYARYLLACALGSNPQLRLHVINPSSEIQEKFRKFLRDSNVDLNRYVPIQRTFKQYIDRMIRSL